MNNSEPMNQNNVAGDEVCGLYGSIFSGFLAKNFHASKPLILVCSLLFVGTLIVSAEENVILPANGGVLDSFTGEFDANYSAAHLTNGITAEAGWASPKRPKIAHEFVYSFKGGNHARLTDAVIHGGTGEGQYYSKDVEVYTSTDGVTYNLAGRGTLANASNQTLTVDLNDSVVKNIKLVITSGYDKNYWELGEFVVNGAVVYPLTVNNGTGSGSYEFGTVVDISADAAPTDMKFDVWTVNSGSVVINNLNAESTTLVMPASAASVTPSYIPSIPTSNQPPVWVSNPTVKANAKDSVIYSGSLSADVSDNEGDTLTFNKAAGPAWLSVSSNGVLSGTPSLSDVGLNTFTVNVSDGINASVGCLIQIAVDLPDGYSALGNVISPANGGFLDSFTSQYGGVWNISKLTNGIVNEDGWSSAVNPGALQEFVYSFSGGNNAVLTDVVVHGGTGGGQYYSKDIEVWTSANGVDYNLAGSGTLANSSGSSLTFDLAGILCKKIKFRITSGYRTDYWEIGEFVANGMIVYPLVVDNGTGDGNYELGAEIAIEADTISGQTFDSWIVVSGTPLIADASNPSTTLIVPTGGAVVAASYNLAPIWTEAPTITMSAQETEAFSGTLSTVATDPESDSLIFSKISGPAWLAVATNGGLTGTPGITDVGVNTFTVALSDGLNPAVLATLEINVSPTAFTAWAQNQGITNRTDDSDGDGYNNEFEYLMGMNPKAASNPRIPSVAMSGGRPTFTYTYRTDATISYRVLTSNDLDNWVTADVTPGVPLPNGDGTSTITVISNLSVSSAPKQFFMLEVVE
jgi:hypothetical protein